MQTDGLQVGGFYLMPNLVSLLLGYFTSVFVNRKGGKFDTCIAAFPGEGEGPVKRPILERFVANCEPHRGDSIEINKSLGRVTVRG